MEGSAALKGRQLVIGEASGRVSHDIGCLCGTGDGETPGVAWRFRPFSREFSEWRFALAE